MIELSKQFTRERSLFYMYAWEDLERSGYKKWLGYEIKNILFVREGTENKVTIWFDPKELDLISKIIISKIDSLKFLDSFKEFIEKEWDFLRPFVHDEKTITDVATLRKYYKSIVNWWTAMTIVFAIPDIEGVKSDVKAEALRMRIETEKYSSKYNRIFEEFFIGKFPQYKKFVHVVSPHDVFKLQKREFTSGEIANLEKRLNGYGLLNRRIYLLGGLKKIMSKQHIQLEDGEAPADGIIRGKIAYKGRVIGKVCIVMSKKAIRSFKQGDIFVSDMTDPDFLPALKKATAIVTDEGGITCHAAIVAREFNKPCIVGSKIATKILKNGDLVEVDADHGIVKILS